MEENFGSDFITLINDDGEEFELEHLDTIEYGGNTYMAMLPTDIDENDDDFGFIILKAVNEDGEEILVTVDDEEELGQVYDEFLRILFDDEDDDE